MAGAWGKKHHILKSIALKRPLSISLIFRLNLKHTDRQWPFQFIIIIIIIIRVDCCFGALWGILKFNRIVNAFRWSAFAMNLSSFFVNSSHQRIALIPAICALYGARAYVSIPCPVHKYFIFVISRIHKNSQLEITELPFAFCNRIAARAQLSVASPPAT